MALPRAPLIDDEARLRDAVVAAGRRLGVRQNRQAMAGANRLQAGPGGDDAGAIAALPGVGAQGQGDLVDAVGDRRLDGLMRPDRGDDSGRAGADLVLRKPLPEPSTLRPSRKIPTAARSAF